MLSVSVKGKESHVNSNISALACNLCVSAQIYRHVQNAICTQSVSDISLTAVHLSQAWMWPDFAMRCYRSQQIADRYVPGIYIQAACRRAGRVSMRVRICTT